MKNIDFLKKATVCLYEHLRARWIVAQDSSKVEFAYRRLKQSLQWPPEVPVYAHISGAILAAFVRSCFGKRERNLLFPSIMSSHGKYSMSRFSYLFVWMPQFIASGYLKFWSKVFTCISFSMLKVPLITVNLCHTEAYVIEVGRRWHSFYLETHIY